MFFMSNRIQEIIMAGVLVMIATFLLNPLHWWMPSMLVTGVVIGLVAVFAVFVSFLWREEARDERETVLRMHAGRAGFLTGTGILVCGIVVQAFSHTIDPWLVGALAVMVVAKIISRSLAEQKH